VRVVLAVWLSRGAFVGSHHLSTCGVAAWALLCAWWLPQLLRSALVMFALAVVVEASQFVVMSARYLFPVVRGCGQQRAQASCCLACGACIAVAQHAVVAAWVGCIPVQTHTAMRKHITNVLDSCAAFVAWREAGAQGWRDAGAQAWRSYAVHSQLPLSGGSHIGNVWLGSF
jgi:hypothetical protein